MPEPSASLEELARAAQAGDAGALEELLVQVQPRVRRVVGRMLLHPQDAEEATQDALLAVARNIDRFEGRSAFTTWVHAVASNSARSTYRSLKRRAHEHPTDELPAHADPRTTIVIAGSRLDLLEALEALGARSPELVEALVLRDVGELDYNEIARLLDAPLGTIKSRIHEARKLVRPLLVARD
jgi:RNA polymerase sigma-70 factor (ECF subfamily)